MSSSSIFKNDNYNCDEYFIGIVDSVSNYEKNYHPLSRFFYIKGNIYSNKDTEKYKKNDIIEKDINIFALCKDGDHKSFKDAFNMKFFPRFTFPLIGEKVHGTISREYQNENPHKIDARPQARDIYWFNNQIPFLESNIITRSTTDKPSYHIKFNNNIGLYFNTKTSLNNHLKNNNIDTISKLENYINIFTNKIENSRKEINDDNNQIEIV